MNDSLENRANIGKCPESEALSAHFDREEPLDKDAATHVSVCETCGKRLADYGLISKNLKSVLSSSQPEDLALRIKAGVHEKLKREAQRPPINFPYWLSSAAAAVAVCALGAYMVTHMERPQREAEPQPMEYAEKLTASPSALVPSELSVPQSAAPSIAATEAPVLPARRNMPDSFGAIDLNQLSSVSFGGDDGARMMAGAAESGTFKRPATIDSSVKHVWMLQTGVDLPGYLKSMESTLSLDPRRISTAAEGDGEVRVSFDVSRRQAVAIVRSMKAAGFELLSPQQPQPEQKVFNGNGDEPVKYEANFVFKR